MHISTLVPGTGTNFMPREFTNGLSFAAASGPTEPCFAERVGSKELVAGVVGALLSSTLRMLPTIFAGGTLENSTEPSVGLVKAIVKKNPLPSSVVIFRERPPSSMDHLPDCSPP